MQRHRISSQNQSNLIKTKNTYNSSIHTANTLNYPSYSIGKNIHKIDFKNKVNSIKDKCLAKSIQPVQIIKPAKFHESPEEHNYTLGQEELDMSYLSSEEQTDDAQVQFNNNQITTLKKSKFPGRPPTIHFFYPKYCQLENKTNKHAFYKIPLIDLKYKIYGSQYRCIMNAFESNGYKKTLTKDWDVFFDVRGSQIKRICSKIQPHKRFNHFAGCWHMGRKDKLWKCIEKMKRIFPEDYNFVPKTYIFPHDYERFETVRETADKDQLWIQKPVASACGRCIKLVKKDTHLRKKRNVLISQYISNPHLINHLKYDLRIYVLVTSFNPLKIYLYENGLVRFATEEYNKDKKDLKKKFVHLTNFSINKHSKKFIPNNNTENCQKMSKWSIKALKKYYEDHGINHQKIFAQIEEVIIKTCISAESSILTPRHRHQDRKSCFFEVYGFDILIDDKFKPWLLEVNVCPSLCSSSPLDRKIKHTLLTDILNLVGVPYEPNQNSVMEGSTLSQSPKKSSPYLRQKPLKRGYKFKNSTNIHNLSFENCVQLLDPEDWLIIFEHEEEMDRLGHFKKIFPSAKNIHKFQNKFEVTRYSNLILWRYLLSQKNFLSRLGL